MQVIKSQVEKSLDYKSLQVFVAGFRPMPSFPLLLEKVGRVSTGISLFSCAFFRVFHQEGGSICT